MLKAVITSRRCFRNYSTFDHVPVLLDETIKYLLWSNADSRAVYVDCTFGKGGYSELILSSAPNAHVISIDIDKEATAPHVQHLHATYGNRFHFRHGNYSQIEKIVKEYAEKYDIENKVDGIVYDLGVSSMQIDDPARGFSFRHDREGPLDMRMDRTSDTSFTASEAVNNLSINELTRIIDQYGEDKNAKRIAVAIQQYRDSVGPIQSTIVLGELVRKAIRNPTGKINPATKTFQALRIYVNDELNHLRNSLKQSARVIKPGGHMCVVSFHSLEDRIVKDQLKEIGDDDEPLWLPVLKKEKVITPEEEELEENPRARSAKLRVLSRTGADM